MRIAPNCAARASEPSSGLMKPKPRSVHRAAVPTWRTLSPASAPGGPPIPPPPYPPIIIAGPAPGGSGGATPPPSP